MLLTAPVPSTAAERADDPYFFGVSRQYLRPDLISKTIFWTILFEPRIKTNRITPMRSATTALLNIFARCYSRRRMYRGNPAETRGGATRAVSRVSAAGVRAG
jgi:hypothetical protein